jgi:hypothetical protein
MAMAALSDAGQGRRVASDDVVVVVGPARVVEVPGSVEVVAVLEVVVVEPDPVAVVTKRSGSATATPAAIKVRAVSRSDTLEGTCINYEDNGSPIAAI